jgi:hypothetical protein
MIFATELLSQSGRDNFQLLFFRLTGIQTRVNLCSPRIRWAKGKVMNTNPISSVMLTMEICPNCKGEMTITEAGPVLLSDHLETITYQCKACRSELKCIARNPPTRDISRIEFPQRSASGCDIVRFVA